MFDFTRDGTSGESQGCRFDGKLNIVGPNFRVDKMFRNFSPVFKKNVAKLHSGPEYFYGKF